MELCRVKEGGGKWTYRDYCQWPDDERWELIDGVAYALNYVDPPPSTLHHQEILLEIARQIKTFLLDKVDKIFIAPYDVCLPETDETGNDASIVVQPDIVVVCDRSKLKSTGCTGAPDMVVEILSPATAMMDLREKFHLYERHGVKEYWIVNPAERIVHVYRNGAENRYGSADIYGPEDKPVVGIFPELTIDLPLVFRE